MDNILICTVGLPRSGKSTWAKRQGLPIVNKDSLRYAIYGQRFWAPGEHLIRSHALIMVRSLFMAGHNCVILDECNASINARLDWIDEGSKSEFIRWITKFKIFDTSPDICKKRASDDRLREVINSMSEHLFDKDGKFKIGGEYEII